MTRIVIVLYCSVSLWSVVSAQGLGPINGELRYQYQYQDFTSAGSHSVTTMQSPMLKLNGAGSLLSPSILSFDLQTILILTSSSATAAQSSLTSKTFYWDYYNATFTILPEFPITSSLQLTDGFTKTSSSSERFDRDGGRLRRQQQNLILTTHQIPFLPNVRFSAFRRHQWSLESERPVDDVGTNYSINLSSAGKGGSVSVSGSVSENSERYSGSSTRYSTILLNGTRTISEQQMLSYNVNYNKFADATSISGLASYLNSSGKEIHYNASLSSRAYSGPTYQSKLISLSQLIQYIQDENFRYNLGMNGSYGKDEFSSSNSYSGSTSSGGASFSVQHSRRLHSVGISNGVSIGYGISQFRDRQATFTTGLSNSVSMSVGSYALAAGHSITYGNLKNGLRRNWVSNSANIDVSGTTIYNFLTRVNATYQSDVNSGELPVGFGNTQEIRLQWTINSPMFTYDRLQFSIGLSGSEYWFIVNSTDRVSVWSANFACSQSYIRNLTFVYHFNRSVDRISHQQSISHAVEMHYQWRAISMDLRFENFRQIDNRNNLWLIFSRPF